MYELKNVELSILIGFFVYVISEITLHSAITKTNKFSNVKRNELKISWELLSIGYACASYYKGDSTDEQRGLIIECFNKWNLVFSGVLLIISFAISLISKEYLMFLIGFNFWRFYSRSLEIILAFGLDVFDESPQSDPYLNKLKRLKLAVKSYFEIYLYSASFYIALNIDNCDAMQLFLKATLMSLAVGTLTNVAYAQTSLSKIKDCMNYAPPDWLQLMPFIQVVATLSLVVLSLAMYISRKSDSVKGAESLK